ncbi:AraC family transcriptional regulator of arabinose operon [Nonomuraea muscovyensis]|uniref:AraC family transcriptional regulator of arabinose operon n=1 Tax=Nonomuraea muscovyensis TaxID=1124761 RepID=A0A7X0C2A1_9ACTN|nr:AraC family transcriptional regulator [Nonomuraea muscovyensis]MBB6346366.1 AraC family transcriptional regulator of arabinose operon [Nonomuraea muscovyensis]
MTAEDLSVPAAELIIVGHFDKTPGYATRRSSGWPSWLLMWTQSGAGLVEQAGASFTAGPGDLVVLASGAAQEYRVAPGRDRWRFWWVHFQPRPSWSGRLGPYARAAGCHLVGGVPGALHDRIDGVFHRALRDARWISPADDHPLRPAPVPEPPSASGELGPAVAASGPARELVLGAIEEVLVLATASARRSGDGGDGGDARVRRALALIAAEPGAPHSVASLARAVALSSSRFAHLFTSEVGCPPMRAVRQARVRHAARLLEVTDMDIGQVAAASGFVSPFHFSRAFRQEYGLPPRDYRNRLARNR